MTSQSLLLAHRLEGKKILIVGGGEVAYTRLLKLDKTGVAIYLVSPEITPSIQSEFVDTGRIVWVCKKYSIDDLQLFHGTAYTPEEDSLSAQLAGSSIQSLGELSFEQLKARHQSSTVARWAFVMTCLNDSVVSETVYYHSKLLFPDVPVNVADNPPFCDFYFGANVELGEQGEMQILISSNGVSPRFTSLLKTDLYRNYASLAISGSCAKLKSLRTRIREITPGRAKEDIEYRMTWVKYVTDQFGLYDCDKMDVDKLIALYGEMFASKTLEFPAELKANYRDTEILN